MGVCLDLDTFERLLARELSKAEERDVEHHLAGCDSCRESLEEFESGWRAGERLRVAVAGSEPEAGVDPDLDRTPAESVEDESADTGFGPLPRGTMVGPYRIIDQLGRGSFGEVYLAQREAPYAQNVALKVLRTDRDTGGMMQRFELERRLLARMRHPSIASILDGGVTDSGRPYLVMEWIDGAPITKYCNENRLDVESRLELFEGLCYAVQHAHQNGIIHRDLKPANILVTREGSDVLTKVIDFGIAKVVGDPSQGDVTGESHFIGTPRYCAPEQIPGEGQRPDTRSDVYSLGVVLLDLLVGEVPIDKALASRGLGSSDVLHLVRTVEPVPASRMIRDLASRDSEGAAKVASFRKTTPEGLARRVSGDVERIIGKCLERDPAQRYASADDIAVNLRKHRRHEAVDPTPPSKAYLLRKFLRRNRLQVAAALLGILTIAVGGFAGSRAVEVARLKAAQRVEDRNAEFLARFGDLGGSYLIQPDDAASMEGEVGAADPRIEELIEFAADFDDYAEPALQVALVTRRAKRPDLAEAWARVAIRRDPTSRTAARANLVLADMGVDRSASSERAEELLGDRYEAERIAFSGEKHADAQVDLLESMLDGLDDEDVIGRFWVTHKLALTLLRNDRFDRALELWRDLVSVFPDLGAAHTNLGLSLLKRAFLCAASTDERIAESVVQDLLEAESAFGNAVQAGETPARLRNRAVLRLYLSHFGESSARERRVLAALGDIERLREVEGESAQDWIFLGSALGECARLGLRPGGYGDPVDGALASFDSSGEDAEELVWLKTSLLWRAGRIDEGARLTGNSKAALIAALLGSQEMEVTKSAIESSGLHPATQVVARAKLFELERNLRGAAGYLERFGTKQKQVDYLLLSAQYHWRMASECAAGDDRKEQLAEADRRIEMALGLVRTKLILADSTGQSAELLGLGRSLRRIRLLEGFLGDSEALGAAKRRVRSLTVNPLLRRRGNPVSDQLRNELAETALYLGAHSYFVSRNFSEAREFLEAVRWLADTEDPEFWYAFTLLNDAPDD